VPAGIAPSDDPSLSAPSALVSIHRPLGVAILILVVVRFINRRLNPPPVPVAMSRAERLAATGSEWTLYGLLRDGRLSR
jgi:cytochrome b561